MMLSKKISVGLAGLVLAIAPATAAHATPVTAQVPAAPVAAATGGSQTSSYFDPITQYLTRAQVAAIYSNIQNERPVCHVLEPALPSWAGCGSPAALQEAVIAAHLTGQTVRMDYYIHTGVTSLNYVDYTVVPAQSGGGGSAQPQSGGVG